MDRKFPLKEQPAREMHDAECSECKRSIKLPFKPDPNRPVYCRECFEKRKAQAAEKPVEKPKNDEAKPSQGQAAEKPVELSSTAAESSSTAAGKPGNDQAQPSQGQAKPDEISLNKLPARPQDREAGEAGGPARAAAGPSPVKSNLASSAVSSRKEVDLESLRSTLGDIMPKSKGRGIIKEGEEVNF